MEKSENISLIHPLLEESECMSLRNLKRKEGLKDLEDED